MHTKLLIRRSLLTLGLLALGLVTLGWAPPASTAAVGVSGETFGSWDLPVAGSNGAAKGVLNDQNNATVFTMGAVLVETPSPSLSQRRGTIRGELFNLGPALYPRYFVSGDWSSNRAGQGKFGAVIFKQNTPLGPSILIGKMAGVFSDPPSLPNRVGKYKGEWKAVL